jgi:hypothetical protein
MKLVVTIIFSLSLLLNSYDALARTKPKKMREKDHPNYQKYLNDEEFRSGRTTRITGILLSSIGGGTGAAAFIVGVLWNSCYGASDKDLSTCKRNARNTMAAGILVGGASLGVGIPMISVGGTKMGSARSRIDEAHPIKETNEDEGNEASLNYGSQTLAQQRLLTDDLSFSVRVLNLQF